MQIQIDSTDQLTTIDGVPVRCWHGITASGKRCHVFVHRIAVANDENAAEFERELAEQLPPGETWPLRRILP